MNPDRSYLSDLSGVKKALVIGIDYKDSKHKQLFGPVNDAKNMVTLLRCYGFKQDNIKLLTDEGEEDFPSKDRILQEMEGLVNNPKPNDSLFFYFSGHGGQKDDEDGDEWDSKDEVLFSADSVLVDGVLKHQSITDDELYDILVRRLPPKCRLTAVFDCCRSGTILDLPYEYDENGQAILPKPSMFNFFYSFFGKVYDPQINLRKSDFPKDVICFSACKDTQRSGALLGKSESAGKFTLSFIVCTLRKPKPVMIDMLKEINSYLEKDADAHKEAGATFINIQNPQISSGYRLNEDDWAKLFAI